MRTPILRFCLLFFFCLSILPFGLTQEERIINYDTEIQINKDRSIQVIENITVYVSGNIIKRGLKREFSSSRTLNNKSTSIIYKIRSVKKNGQAEPYHTQKDGTYESLYIGDEDIFLNSGEYLYTIEYTVPNQIALYENYDEFYWNPIGTNWVFAIEKGTCKILLPPGATVIHNSCYTGGYGNTESNCSQEISNGHREITFQLSKSLSAREGFTIKLGFEKGFIDPPSFYEKFGAIIFLVLGLITLFFYYIRTWNKHGIDPPKPAAYPIFDSPNSLSPASLGYISKEGYRNNSITSSIIHLAINGYLKIEERVESGFFTDSTIYDLTQLNDNHQNLFEEEKTLMDSLFENGNTFSIDGAYNQQMETAYNAHKAAMDEQHSSFVNEGNNLKFIIFPILFTLLVALISYYIIINNTELSMEVVFYFLLLAGISIPVYTYLIRKPTPKKLALQSKIDGFKMYLEMAEKDRLNLLNPPDKTPEHFEAMLPFAYALGVEHSWSTIFKSILEKAMYRPEWSNNSNIYVSNSFSSNFSQSISSAATPPSSSGSSGGGGGFSGGGGGGGGGGGW